MEPYYSFGCECSRASGDYFFTVLLRDGHLHACYLSILKLCLIIFQLTAERKLASSRAPQVRLHNEKNNKEYVGRPHGRNQRQGEIFRIRKYFFIKQSNEINMLESQQIISRNGQKLSMCFSAILWLPPFTSVDNKDK